TASSSNGFSRSPALKSSTRQSLLPATALFVSRGNRPARTNDDLPVPDAPTTARNRCVGSLRRWMSLSTSFPRPKKIASSLAVKARKPGYGESGQEGSGATCCLVLFSSRLLCRMMSTIGLRELRKSFFSLSANWLGVLYSTTLLANEPSGFLKLSKNRLTLVYCSRFSW